MDTQYVLSLSYGKDSLACLEAIKLLGLPLDRIIHSEVWATDTIPADLPPMIEFKSKADKIIKQRYGLEVEHICATNKDGSKKTYEQIFYHIPKRKYNGKIPQGTPAGFPYQKGAWCNDRLKVNVLEGMSKDSNIIRYLGIACDEPERIKRHDKPNIKLPLVEIGWDEIYCRKWCKENDLLSPIYISSNRGGVGFVIIKE